MKKVLILGCAGSGKSTFARKLKNIINVPVYHLDMIWHKPDKTTVTFEEFDNKLYEILKKDEWIIDGNYQRTIEIRLKECDSIFLLDYPLEVCFEGAASRIGKKREDLPFLEEEMDEGLKNHIINFSKNKLPNLYRLVEKYSKEKDVNIFKSRQEANEYLNKLKISFNGSKD